MTTTSYQGVAIMIEMLRVITLVIDGQHQQFIERYTLPLK